MPINRWVLFAILFAIFSISIIYGNTIFYSAPGEDDHVTEDKELEEKIQEETTLLFRKEYKDSDFIEYFDEDDPPEMFKNFDFQGFKKEEMKAFLPGSWELELFSEEFVSLVYEGDEYENYIDSELEEDLEDKKYISIYKDRIAIYKGEPGKGELIEVTPHEVKEVYEDELKEGIPFISEEEREQILESYTS